MFNQTFRESRSPMLPWANWARIWARRSSTSWTCGGTGYNFGKCVSLKYLNYIHKFIKYATIQFALWLENFCWNFKLFWLNCVFLFICVYFSIFIQCQIRYWSAISRTLTRFPLKIIQLKWINMYNILPFSSFNFTVDFSDLTCGTGTSWTKLANES